MNFLKNKITGVLLATLVCLGIMGTITVQPSKAYAAVPASVGIVDIGLLINQHPDTLKANETLKAEDENAKKEFDAKSATMSDKEKQDLILQLRQKVEEKRQQLLKTIADKINVAIKTVADAKGLTLIVPKTFVVYDNSGLDITDEVMKKIRQ